MNRPHGPCVPRSGVSRRSRGREQTPQPVLAVLDPRGGGDRPSARYWRRPVSAPCIPATHDTIEVQSLLSKAGLTTMVEGAVENFATFPPLATILIVGFGIAVAEASGLFTAMLRRMVAASAGQVPDLRAVDDGDGRPRRRRRRVRHAHPARGALIFRAAGRSPVLGCIVAYVSIPPVRRLPGDHHDRRAAVVDLHRRGPHHRRGLRRHPGGELLLRARLVGPGGPGDHARRRQGPRPPIGPGARRAGHRADRRRAEDDRGRPSSSAARCG